jgi:hypothetical protein
MGYANHPKLGINNLMIIYWTLDRF